MRTVDVDKVALEQVLGADTQRIVGERLRALADPSDAPVPQLRGVPTSFAGFTVLRVIGQGGWASSSRPSNIHHDASRAQGDAAGSFNSGHGEQPYFAMERIDGVDLLSHADRARLDRRARLALIAQVADGVHHAHERGIVHRDLKPDNVLVDQHGVAKVLLRELRVASRACRSFSTPFAVR